jgi:hypothetical protein
MPLGDLGDASDMYLSGERRGSLGEMRDLRSRRRDRLGGFAAKVCMLDASARGRFLRHDCVCCQSTGSSVAQLTGETVFDPGSGRDDTVAAAHGGDVTEV